MHDEAVNETHKEVEEYIRDKSLTRAKPYNASAKQIEGVFGILERGFFSMIRGHLGGDRMNKHTHKLGAQPRAFEGTEKEFEAHINEALNFYRNTPQNNKTSPNEKRAAFYAKGWKPYTATDEVFLFAFSEVVRLKVQTGGIEKDGAFYYSDALIPYIGQTREIRFAKWDRSQLFFIDADGKYIAIPKTQTYGQLDKAGAIEQGRRAGVMNKHLRSLKNETKPLDLMAEVKRHNATQPPPPTLPQGIPITLGTESKAIGEALKAAPLALVIPQSTGGKMRHPTTGQVLEIDLPKPENTPKPKAFDLLADITANYLKHEKEKEQWNPMKKS